MIRLLPLAEYLDPANGWHQYQSAGSRERAEWTAERMSEPGVQIAIVERQTAWTIARRYQEIIP